jgi:hypothetical protein
MTSTAQAYEWVKTGHWSLRQFREWFDAQQHTWAGSGDLEDSNAYQAPPAHPPQRTEQEPCVHAKTPKECYRVRCQLGDKCVDDEMSFRTTPPQPEQEPVIDKSAAKRIATALGWEPKRTWVGLTGEEMFSCNLDEEGWMIDREVAKRNVEALLKEKNT